MSSLLDEIWEGLKSEKLQPENPWLKERVGSEPTIQTIIDWFRTRASAEEKANYSLHFDFFEITDRVIGDQYDSLKIDEVRQVIADERMMAVEQRYPNEAFDTLFSQVFMNMFENESGLPQDG